MKSMPQTPRDRGFSLVELLVAIAVGSIIIALIVTAYWSQTQTGRTQQMMVDMQQNLRAAVFFMQQDIMMAGFENDYNAPIGAEITNAGATSLTFSFADPISRDDNIDNDGDGQIDEAQERDGVDNDGDGPIDELEELETVRFSLDADNTLHRRLLQAENGNAIRQDEEIARGIEQLEFFYTLEDGTSCAGGGCVDTQDERDDIRTIGISILARSSSGASGYTDTRTYLPLSNPTSGVVWGPYNDHIRRELVTTTIYCRNLLQ